MSFAVVELVHHVAHVGERILHQQGQAILQRLLGALVVLKGVFIDEGVAFRLDPLGGAVELGGAGQGSLGRGLEGQLEVEPVEEVVLLLDA